MKNILFLIAVIITIASCSPRLTPFTSNLRNEQGWTEEDLQKIQFYLSDEIVLWRQVTDGDSKISNGTIKIRNGKKVEEIRFAKRTPGVFLFEPKSNRFAVSFESDDNRYLMFGPSKRRANFVLLAADRDKHKGKISYDDKIYFTSDDSAFTSLMVDLRKAKETIVNRRNVKGRTID